MELKDCEKGERLRKKIIKIQKCMSKKLVNSYEYTYTSAEEEFEKIVDTYIEKYLYTDL